MITVYMIIDIRIQNCVNSNSILCPLEYNAHFNAFLAFFPKHLAGALLFHVSRMVKPVIVTLELYYEEINDLLELEKKAPKPQNP